MEIAKKLETVDRCELHSSRMGCGKGKPTTVIVDGIVQLYVGMGWIKLHTASKDDYMRYPVAV